MGPTSRKSWFDHPRILFSAPKNLISYLMGHSCGAGLEKSVFFKDVPSNARWRGATPGASHIQLIPKSYVITYKQIKLRKWLRTDESISTSEKKSPKIITQHIFCLIQFKYIEHVPTVIISNLSQLRMSYRNHQSELPVRKYPINKFQ